MHVLDIDFVTANVWLDSSLGEVEGLDVANSLAVNIGLLHYLGRPGATLFLPTPGTCPHSLCLPGRYDGVSVAVY
jgi:hypothetical protein